MYKNNKGEIVRNYNENEIYNFRKLSNKLKNHFSIEFESRNEIIENVISSMCNGFFKENLPVLNDFKFKIIRGDIKKFFPSIKNHKLMKMIMNEAFLTRKDVNILRNVLNETNGLPLGNPLSSVLAEIYLINFDKKIKNEIEYIYYKRFVDDFIIIIPDNKNNENFYLNKIQEILAQIGLQLSYKKYNFIEYNPKMYKHKNCPYTNCKYKNGNPNSWHFDFLGYEFNLRNKAKHNKYDAQNKNDVEIYRNLYVGISKKKIEKILHKIKRAFRVLYKEQNNFNLLYYKLEFILKGITSLDFKGNTQKQGIPYTYCYINDFKNLKFIHSRIMILSRVNHLNKYDCKKLFDMNKFIMDKNNHEFKNNSFINYKTMSKSKVNDIYSNIYSNCKKIKNYTSKNKQSKVNDCLVTKNDKLNKKHQIATIRYLMNIL